MAQHGVASPWLSFTVSPFESTSGQQVGPSKLACPPDHLQTIPLKNIFNRCIFHHFPVPSFPLPRWSSSRRPGHPAHSQRLARASRCSWTNHPRQSQSSHPGPENKTTLDALRKPTRVRGIWNLSIHWLKENVATVLIHWCWGTMVENHDFAFRGSGVHGFEKPWSVGGMNITTDSKSLYSQMLYTFFKDCLYSSWLGMETHQLPKLLAVAPGRTCR